MTKALMMLSNLVLGFIKRVLDSDEPIDEVINSYAYSERFVIAVDFEVMHKAIRDISEQIYDKAAQNHDPTIGLAFLKQLNNSTQVIAKVANLYNEEQRCHIGVSIFNIQEKLLADVKSFFGEKIELDENDVTNTSETNH